MENKDLIPSKTTTGLLDKLKRMFKSIFNKKNNTPQDFNDSIETKTRNTMEPNFMESLKEKTDIECEKETLECIIDNVEKNPQELNTLTIEQLEEVNEYYDKEIEKVEQKINKLKNKE